MFGDWRASVAQRQEIGMKDFIIASLSSKFPCPGRWGEEDGPKDSDMPN